LVILLVNIFLLSTCSNCGFRPVLSEQSAVAAAAAAAAAQRSANHPPLFLPPHLAAQFTHQPLFPGLKGESQHTPSQSISDKINPNHFGLIKLSGVGRKQQMLLVKDKSKSNLCPDQI